MNVLMVLARSCSSIMGVGIMQTRRTCGGGWFSTLAFLSLLGCNSTLEMFCQRLDNMDEPMAHSLVSRYSHDDMLIPYHRRPREACYTDWDRDGDALPCKSNYY
jgi:hypothetical protein